VPSLVNCCNTCPHISVFLSCSLVSDFSTSGREEEEALEGGRGGSLKNLGAGKKTASVLDDLVALLLCISSSNLSNYRQMTA